MTEQDRSQEKSIGDFRLVLRRAALTREIDREAADRHNYDQEIRYAPHPVNKPKLPDNIIKQVLDEEGWKLSREDEEKNKLYIVEKQEE